MTTIERVLRVLKAKNGFIRVTPLATLVYCVQPDGGPLDAKAGIRTCIRRLRKQGHRIENRVWQGYRYLGHSCDGRSLDRPGAGAELTHPPGMVVQSTTTHERTG